MPDRTLSGGVVVTSDAGVLKRRKLQLSRHSIQGEIMRTEIEICELQQTIDTRLANVSRLQEQIEEIDAQLAQPESDPSVQGGT